MGRLVAAFILLVSFMSSAAAQSSPCPLPPNFNPYTDPVPVDWPAECRSGATVPYQVAAGEFKPTAFLFDGINLNAETLAYVDISNKSTYAQRVTVEYQVLNRTILRSYVLPPKQPTSIDIGAKEFPGESLTLSLTVTCERLCNAAVTMRQASNPWGPGALMPTPRIVDLPIPAQQ